jgi:hypothetical protein
MVSNGRKIDLFLDKLMTAFENNGMDAFMNPTESDSECGDDDMEDGKFDSIESIMAMSSEQLQEQTALPSSPIACTSTTGTSLKTIPRLQRKRPAYNSAQEHWNDSLAHNLATTIQTYEDDHPHAVDSDYDHTQPTPSPSNSCASATTSSSRARPTNPDQFSAHKLTTNAETVLDVLISHQNHSNVSKRKHKHLESKDEFISMSKSSIPTSCRKKLSNVSTARSRSTSIDGLDDYVGNAIYNYIHQCQVHRYHPSFDHIHNIVLNAKKRQRDIEKERGSMMEFMHKSVESHLKSSCSSCPPPSSHSVRRLVPNQIRTLVSQLVVQLWKCSQKTPYMTIAKRPSDAFRHFAAGVLFGMRRGMKMADGTVVVPHSRSIEHILQLSTTVPRGTSAHEVHLQAHKGTSTLQRCLGSLENDKARLDVYQPAIAIATSLQELL